MSIDDETAVMFDDVPVINYSVKLTFSQCWVSEGLTLVLVSPRTRKL